MIAQFTTIDDGETRLVFVNPRHVQLVTSACTTNGNTLIQLNGSRGNYIIVEESLEVVLDRLFIGEYQLFKEE